MPSSADVLSGLGEIANQGFGAAVAWHLAIAAVLAAVLFGWRPSRRVTAFGLSLPLFSVAGFAASFGNPFNAVAFFAIAILAGVIAASRTLDPIHRPAWWIAWVGAALVVFAWLYPHFLVGRPPTAYLYAAPVGLLPCPTLALVIGGTLLCGGLGRAWAAVLVLFGTFYALFGVIRLGVPIDLVLLAGAVALGLVSLRAVSAEPEPA